MVYVGKMALFIICSVMSLNLLAIIVIQIIVMINPEIGSKMNYLNYLITVCS